MILLFIKVYFVVKILRVQKKFTTAGKKDSLQQAKTGWGRTTRLTLARSSCVFLYSLGERREGGGKRGCAPQKLSIL